MSDTIPVGWGDRQNAVSEKDLKLGAAAANKFSSNKGAQTASSAYMHTSNMDQPVTYKTSDEVRAFYLSKIEGEQPPLPQQQHPSQSATPFGWEERQKARNIEAAQMGVFSSQNAAPTQSSRSTVQPVATTTSAASSEGQHQSAEVALVKVATHTLDTMASTLEQHPTSLSPQDRAAFASAMQRAMNALAKCK